MNNPVLWADFPDPDVIRVGNLYYMITTTMHMFPGGDILRSRDLVHWEPCCHVFDRLDSTPAQRLQGGQIYGQGMWAACIRFHEGVFHVFFACNDTRKTYHYSASSPEGPWTRSDIEGFYHDCSVLFDDDGRVYIAYGNRQIRITELKKDLSGPLPGGLDRVAVTDDPGITLGYEGTHFYKHNGRYYLFFIHWDIAGGGRRTEACFVSDRIDGEFTGGDVLNDDMGFMNRGVAQGGIVDTPDGEWYAMLFQDHGAVGRVPVLVPVRWKEDRPVFHPVPLSLDGTVRQVHRPLKPLTVSDPLRGETLSEQWQWNHEPDKRFRVLTPLGLRLFSGTVTDNPELAVNTLTQRAFGPKCAFEVTVDASGLKPGDRAGLIALQGHYAALLVVRGQSGLRLTLRERDESGGIRPDFSCRDPGRDTETVDIEKDVLRLRAVFDFSSCRDTVTFSCDIGGGSVPIGNDHRLCYQLDHFMGVRIGLCCYSTEKTGGSALFRDFVYIPPEELSL